MDKTERQISLYSSLAITTLLNSGKLLALRESGLLSRLWRFDIAEFGFQLTAIFLFCYLFFVLNLGTNSISALRVKNKLGSYLAINGLIFFVFTGTLAMSFRFLFYPEQVPVFFRAIHFSRFGLSLILTGMMVKVMLLMRESGRQARENEQLKSSYMHTELELLKDQMNPHFLFNSLSSLSAVVREDPVLAQQYIVHLSRVFRYALNRPANNLVTVGEELKMVESFAQLFKMRFEDSFRLEVTVDERFTNNKLPHLSLQPLLENAAKHNAATPERPLVVRIVVENGSINVINNLNPVEAVSNGLGLLNLSERFRILMNQEIIIEKQADVFLVKLPLQHE